MINIMLVVLIVVGILNLLAAIVLNTKSRIMNAFMAGFLMAQALYTGLSHYG